MRPKLIPKIILLLAVLLFFYGFFLGGVQYVLVQAAREFGLGSAGLGILVAVQNGATVVAPAIMGAVADRKGTKPVLICFGLTFSLGCLLAAQAQGMGLFLLGVCLIGAGYSVCESLSSAVASDTDPENGARYINLIQCFLCGGAILAPVTMQLLIEKGFLGWRGLFGICGSAFLAMCIVLMFQRFPVRGMNCSEKGGYGKILRSPFLVCLLASMVVYVGLEDGFGYFAETLFQKRAANQSIGAYCLSAYWAGMAVSRLVYSMIRYPEGRILRLSFAGVATTLLLLILVPQGWISIAACALLGAVCGPIWGTIVAVATKRFPEHSSGVAGLMSACCGISGILYPLLTGTIAEYFSITAAFAMLAGFSLLGGLLCLRTGK